MCLSGVFQFFDSSEIIDDVADEQILQTDNIPKSKPAYRGLERIIGKNSLITIGGEHWKRLRKLFNPAFAPSHLERIIPAIVEESDVFVEKLARIADTNDVIKMTDLTTVIPNLHILPMLVPDG